MTTLTLHTFNFTPKWFYTLKKKYNQNKRYNDTVNELSRLSDAELKDIGIHRGMIRCIAAEVYDE